MEDDRRAGLRWGPTFGAHLRAREPLAFPHALVDDPALELTSVAELANALGVDSVTFEPAVKPLIYAEGAPEPERVHRAGDVVLNLDDNESWLTLLNIEQHPRYRSLIDDQLDTAAVTCGIDPSSMKRRMGFVFASSPHSVTGAHFDIEHSLLLQLRGTRTLSFGTFTDDATREAEISRYWNGSYGKLATAPTPSQDFTIGPGDGIYIPPYTPHWLQNGAATSLSLTITFFTRDNERESLVQAFNERARKLGLTPRRAGESPLRDRGKLVVMRGYSGARRLRKRTPAPR